MRCPWYGLATMAIVLGPVLAAPSPSQIGPATSLISLQPRDSALPSLPQCGVSPHKPTHMSMTTDLLRAVHLHGRQHTAVLRGR
jgi:hypothetical protein